MSWPSFLAGFGIATYVCGVIYWITVAHMRRNDVLWRNEQRKRIDDLAERSERQYAQSRKELGLPPRSMS